MSKQNALKAQQDANCTQIRVPPPDVCQTVNWTAQHLGKDYKIIPYCNYI